MPGKQSAGCGGELRSSGLLSVAALALILSLTPLFSATPDFYFRSWQTQEGLPSNKILDLRQTQDGFIWIATLDGLVRFDGIKFTVFDNTNAEALTDQSLTCLFEGRDGTLWIGHVSGAVTRYKDGRFETTPRPAAQPDGIVKHIAADQTGDIWTFGDTGFLTRQKDGFALKPQQGPAPLQTAMACSPNGRIWVASAGLLSVLEGDRLRVVPLGDSPGSFVQGIGAASDGALWVVSGNRIRKYTEGKWSETLAALPLGNAPVQIFRETARGQLLAGTSDHGLFTLSCRPGGEVRHISRDTGFASDWVPALWEDREGGLWVGTGGAGLFLLRHSIMETPAPAGGWQNRAVLTVGPARHGGLWVGTEGAGLFRLHDGQWENFAYKEGLQNQYVWSVVEDRDGVVLAGTWGNSVYSMKNGTFAQADGFPQSRLPVFAIGEAKEGGQWIGTSLGLLRYRNGQPSWVEPDSHTRLRDIRTVIEGEDGTVWFGSNGGGLGCLRDGQVRHFGKRQGLASEFVQSLYLDGAGALWIGTAGKGLCRFKEGKFSTIGTEQGLANPVICHIEEDARGYMWMSSHGGLIRVRKTVLEECADGLASTIDCLSYGLSDGLPSLKCSGGLQPAGCRLPDGRLAFATSKGLAIVDPAGMETNPLPPPVVIVGVQVDDREATAPPLRDTPVIIGPGFHRLELQYTGLSYVAPEKVRFKRRLLGLEREWVSVGPKRSAEYNYLAPGRYVFQVTACNNDNVWNPEGRSLALVVLPHFWQTLWFKLLLLAALLLASGSGVWFEAQRRLHRRLEILERERAIDAERTRIANDMHDDLGSHLTRITMLSETARADIDDRARIEQGLGLIYETARNVTRAMDEIVWAVNPKHDTLESLVSYFEKFAQDLLGAAGIRCRLDLPVEFPAWRPSSEVRHNLFLAYKEALNNAVRHSGADTVTVSLEMSEAGYRLTVADCGRGFCESALAGRVATEDGRASSGNGFPSMRQRMKGIGGTCEIRSAPGEGCAVSLFVPAHTPGSAGRRLGEKTDVV
jgi:signal transduction histidine kinase/ligand-binding sensor domain-containing protein